MYQHHDIKDDHISLHDCQAERMRFHKGILSCFFPDGFWVMAKHPHNQSSNTVRTDSSQVDFYITDQEIDGISIHLFRKNRRKKVIREEWEPVDFIRAVNRGTFRLEFITQYKGFQTILFKCWVWFDKSPYHAECELVLQIEKVIYHWNRLRCECIW